MLIYLFVIQGYPFVSAIFTSLTDKQIGVPGEFVGFQNYLDLIKEPVFRLAFRNTLVITLISVTLKLVFGMVMALVLNQDLIFKNLWRAVLFLPWTIPTIVTILNFGWMYSSTGGVLNFILLRSGLVNRPVNWLGTPTIALFSVILVNVWRGTPFFGISILGGLQSIPNELYEAAKIDGASFVQRFRFVTLPGVRDVILLVTMVSTIWTLNDFQIIWVLTRGGPANSTQVLSTLTYSTAFLNLDLGKAVAISVITVPLLLILVAWTTQTVLRRES